MESTNFQPTFRKGFQLGAITSLVLAGLCIFAPIVLEMSNILKGTYIGLIFFAFISMIHLLPKNKNRLFAGSTFFGIGHSVLTVLLIFPFFENYILVFNITWLALLFFTISAFFIFSIAVVPAKDVKLKPLMPQSWIVLNFITALNYILWLVMLIAVIVASHSTIVFCQVALLIIFCVQFLLARNTLQKVIEQEF